MGAGVRVDGAGALFGAGPRTGLMGSRASDGLGVVDDMVKKVSDYVEAIRVSLEKCEEIEER